MLASREQNYSDPYFGGVFPKAVRLLRETRVPVIIGNSLLGDGALLRGEHFPLQLVARANGALNLLQFGWAFIVQYGTGLILEQWPLKGEQYPATA